MPTGKLTAERLREVMSYDPETGIFRHRKRNPHPNGIVVGAAAGTQMPDGYLRISIDGKKHQAHRLAWLFVTGSHPTDEIDHINGDRRDNRIVNLRTATRVQNNWNTPGPRPNRLKGARPSFGKWRAIIRINGRQTCLGSFETEHEAHAAYVAASKQHHGAFSRA